MQLILKKSLLSFLNNFFVNFPINLRGGTTSPDQGVSITGIFSNIEIVKNQRKIFYIINKINIKISSFVAPKNKI